MPSGHPVHNMNKRIILFALVALLAYGCKDDKKQDDFTISPEAGTTYKSGEAISVKTSFAADQKPDSIVYLLDSARIGSVKDTSALVIKTDTMALGARVITAKIYKAGKEAQEMATNVVLLAAKAPEELTFKVEKVFPHDTASYTEGLEYHDGYLYESDGGRVAEGTGQSALRKYNLATGKPVTAINIDPEVFAEGITVIGNKLIQLTYTEKVGYVYDKNTLKLLGNFSYTAGREGWGLYFDGTKVLNTDGTNRIFYLDKNNYRQIGYLDVYDNNGAVQNLNELEVIDGKIYANVYQKDDILVIDPKTGAVLQRIDMSGLYPAPRNSNADVLNGIAYDKATNRIFVTGKKWDKLFQVKFVKK